VVWCVRKRRKKELVEKTKYKKKDKSHKKSVHSSAKTGGNWTVILKKLSQLIGACFWCDSSSKSLCLNFQKQIQNTQLSINILSHAIWTWNFPVVLFWFFKSILVSFFRFLLCANFCWVPIFYFACPISFWTLSSCVILLNPIAVVLFLKFNCFLLSFLDLYIVGG